MGRGRATIFKESGMVMSIGLSKLAGIRDTRRRLKFMCKKQEPQGTSIPAENPYDYEYTPLPIVVPNSKIIRSRKNAEA